MRSWAASWKVYTIYLVSNTLSMSFFKILFYILLIVLAMGYWLEQSSEREAGPLFSVTLLLLQSFLSILREFDFCTTSIWCMELYMSFLQGSWKVPYLSTVVCNWNYLIWKRNKSYAYIILWISWNLFAKGSYIIIAHFGL